MWLKQPGLLFHLMYRGTLRPSAYNLWLILPQPGVRDDMRVGFLLINTFHRVQTSDVVVPQHFRLSRALRIQIAIATCCQVVDVTLMKFIVSLKVSKLKASVLLVKHILYDLWMLHWKWAYGLWGFYYQLYDHRSGQSSMTFSFFFRALLF
jgi:hypothetical protein